MNSEGAISPKPPLLRRPTIRNRPAFRIAGRIDDTVLWYVAQCFIYAGSFFGIGIYAYATFDDIKARLGIKEKPPE